MPASFRLKLTLLATGTSAAVIVLFGVTVRAAYDRDARDRIDQELRALGAHFLFRGPPAPEPAEDARDADGDEAGGPVFVGDELREVAYLLVAPDGQAAFRSDDWPAPLADAALPLLPSAAEGAAPLRCERLHVDRSWLPGPARHAPGPAFRSPFLRGPGWGFGRGPGGPGGGPGPHGPGPGGGPGPHGPGPGGGPGPHGPGPGGGPGPRAFEPAAFPGEGPGPGWGRGRGPVRRLRRGPPVDAYDGPCTCGETAFATRRSAGDPWRVAAFPVGAATLYVAANLERFEARAHRVGATTLGVLALALLAAGGGGWWLAGRALGPLVALTAAAEEITADRLERRIPGAGADPEFRRLIDVFNAMLDRLQGSYQQAVRFSADAAHELKTPLAIMQGEVEGALTRATPGSEVEAALVSQLEELQRLKGLVHKLLVLARADAGTLRPRLERFDLSACVVDLAGDVEALSPELRFSVEVAPDVFVAGDPSLLPQVVQNLLANAARYSPPDGAVAVGLTTEGDQARLVVTNAGVEIDPEARERIFDRFVRLDPARARTDGAGGAGLGLSLAREFARAHGGDVSLVASSPEGTTFELRLPIAAPEA